MSSARGHNRHVEHEEHEEHVNHEAWVIPYADMLTLLMALFLVLFAIGRTDLEKFKKMSLSFKQEFGNSNSAQVVTLGGAGDNPAGDGGSGIVSENISPVAPAPTTTSPADQALAEKQATEAAAQAEATSLDGVQQILEQQAALAGLGANLGFKLEARGLVVTIVTDQVLFQAGSADLQAGGVSILDVVAQALTKVPNDVAIEGHTDNRPISSARYPSNWELSNARATSVLRYMLDHDGIPASRLSATGYADTKPVADNSTPEGAAKNRRVEIVVVAEVPLSPALNVDGTLTAETTGATVITEPATTLAPGTAASDPVVPGVLPDMHITPDAAPNLSPGPDTPAVAGTGAL